MNQIELTMISMPEAANLLGYSLAFTNEICKRAFFSMRPFIVLKDEKGKYLVEQSSLWRYLDTCPDYNPYPIPGVFEPDSNDDTAPTDDTVFMLTEEMLPQVCGVRCDAESVPVKAYKEDEKQCQLRASAIMKDYLRDAAERIRKQYM